MSVMRYMPINTCSDHWILIDIDLVNSQLLIFDSLKKPQEQYQDNRYYPEVISGSVPHIHTHTHDD